MKFKITLKNGPKTVHEIDGVREFDAAYVKENMVPLFTDQSNVASLIEHLTGLRAHVDLVE